jgi:hypothetical protein
MQRAKCLRRTQQSGVGGARSRIKKRHAARQTTLKHPWSRCQAAHKSRDGGKTTRKIKHTSDASRRRTRVLQRQKKGSRSHPRRAAGARQAAPHRIGTRRNDGRQGPSARQKKSGRGESTQTNKNNERIGARVHSSAKLEKHRRAARSLTENPRDRVGKTAHTSRRQFRSAHVCLRARTLLAAMHKSGGEQTGGHTGSENATRHISRIFVHSLPHPRIRIGTAG